MAIAHSQMGMLIFGEPSRMATTIAMPGIGIHHIGVPDLAPTMKSAVSAIGLGALDYFLRSDDRDEIADAILSVLAPPRAVPAPPSFDDDGELDDLMIGQSAKIQEVYKLIGKIAESNVLALLVLEYGFQRHRDAQLLGHPDRFQVLRQAVVALRACGQGDGQQQPQRQKDRSAVSREGHG